MLAGAALACGSFPLPGGPTPVSREIPGTRTLTFDEAYYESPAWSPDGRFLATLRSRRWFADIAPPQSPLGHGPVIIDLVSGDQLTIGSPPTVQPENAYSPVLWVLGGEAITFSYSDSSGGQAAPRLVTYRQETKELALGKFCTCAPIALNGGGSEVLVVGPASDSFQLSWFDLATGRLRSELSLERSNPRDYRFGNFALSPDERFLLLDDLQGNVFKYEIGSGEPPAPFLFSAASPAWSPDGGKVAYAKLQRFGSSSPDYYDGQLVIANADGSDPEPLFAETQPAGMLSPTWSPDGTQIAFLYGDHLSNRILIAEVPERLRPLGGAVTPTTDGG